MVTMQPARDAENRRQARPLNGTGGRDLRNYKLSAML